MTDQVAVENRKFVVRRTSDSHFSWIRTRLSVERTFLACLRTATSLIGFGFTIVQFFERFAEMKGVSPPVLPEAPRYVGLALILGGVMLLCISLWQFRAINSYLWSADFQVLAGSRDARYWPMSSFIAVMLLAIGILTFFSILLRLA
jgi:putative membrane protein